jgi:hypothetical protein
MAFAAQLENADRMMTHAEAGEGGIELLFADGRRGIVPFSEIPEVGSLANLAGIELPNAYEILLRLGAARPWNWRGTLRAITAIQLIVPGSKLLPRLAARRLARGYASFVGMHT